MHENEYQLLEKDFNLGFYFHSMLVVGQTGRKQACLFVHAFWTFMWIPHANMAVSADHWICVSRSPSFTMGYRCMNFRVYNKLILGLFLNKKIKVLCHIKYWLHRWAQNNFDDAVPGKRDTRMTEEQSHDVASSAGDSDTPWYHCICYVMKVCLLEKLN